MVSPIVRASFVGSGPHSSVCTSTPCAAVRPTTSSVVCVGNPTTFTSIVTFSPLNTSTRRSRGETFISAGTSCLPSATTLTSGTEVPAARWSVPLRRSTRLVTRPKALTPSDRKPAVMRCDRDAASPASFYTA